MENKFDSDWGAIIEAKLTGDGKFSSDYGLQNLNPTGGPAFSYLGKYKHKHIDVYGLARRGNEWRGSRLNFK